MATVVLFDIDGTLVTTAGGARQALLDAISAQFGDSAGFDFSFGGMTDRGIFRKGLRQRGMDVDDPRMDAQIDALIADYLPRLERLLDYRRELTPQRPPEQIFRINTLLFDPGRLELQGPTGVVNTLSRGDASLLSFFCLSPGIAFEREQLCQATGSLVDATNSRSIDVRISKLRKLLNSCKRGSGRMIEAVRGRGYRLNAEVQADPDT